MNIRRLLSVAVATLLFVYIVVALTFINAEDIVCKDLLVAFRDSSDRQFVSEDDILSVLKHTGLYPVGTPMHAVNTHSIETELLKNGLIAESSAYKTPSGRVKLVVKQKTPVLRVMGVGGSFYVDSQRGIMPMSWRYAAHVPVASGYIGKKMATTELYEFALFLRGDMFWNEQIEQIYVHPNGETELIPHAGSHRILLGTLDDFEEKLSNLRLFYEQAVPKTGWEKYSMINLKFKDQVVCTKK